VCGRFVATCRASVKLDTMGCAYGKPEEGAWNRAYAGLSQKKKDQQEEFTRQRANSILHESHSAEVKKKQDQFIMVNDYTLGKVLGKGAYGSVQATPFIHCVFCSRKCSVNWATHLNNLLIFEENTLMATHSIPAHMLPCCPCVPFALVNPP